MTKKGFESFDIEEIADEYIGVIRFKVDCISLLGADIFSGFGKYMNLFGFFKLMRVFRIGVMIKRTNLDEGSKSILNLLKIFFYLFFYLHLINCYWWITIGYNTGTRFYRNKEKNMYISSYGEVMLGDDGLPVPAGEFDLLWGTPPTWAEDDWMRWTASDSPDWETINANWQGRLKNWYMPREWINFPDQTLFTPAYDKFKRYITMFYYSCMNLGVGEFGPANKIEYFFCVGSMLCSFLFNALIFGDVVTLV
jgi:hypothetical protein